MYTDFLNLFTSSLTILYATYGSWFLIKEIFFSIVPFTIILTVLFVLILYLMRIPPPNSEAVEALLGKDPLSALDNSQSRYVMKTVAHRGAGLDAPENSLAAFQLCHEKGCDAIEFDVTLTDDGIPIIFHDSTLERLADSNLIVNASKWEDLMNIDISVKHSYKDRFANTNIPTLDQAVAQMLSCGQRMFIDIKDNNIKMVPVILNLYNKYPELISQALVTSFFPHIIYLVRRGNPKITCSLAWRPYVFSSEFFKYPEGKGPRRTNVWYKHYFLHFCDLLHSWALPKIIYYILGLSVILLHKDSISGEAILKWNKKGVRVIAWTVNSPVEKQHFSKNLKITYLTDTLTGESTAHSIPS